MAENLSLRVKVSVSLTILFVIIIGSLITLNVFNQRSFMNEEIHRGTVLLSNSIYSGISYPMSLGDGKAIQEQIAHLKKNMQNGEIFIFGYDKSVTYSSDAEKVNTDLSKQIKSAEMLGGVNKLLQDGKSLGRGYREMIGGKLFVSELLPIINEKRCHQCHDPERHVLGGMMIRQNSEEVYSKLAKLRNKNILVGVFSCVILILILNVLISKLISRPISRVAEGLSSGSDQVVSESSHISSASQSLAEGASEQAA